jgi:hypothetical protein
MISRDGLRLYSDSDSSDHPDGLGGVDMWIATRPDDTAEFGPPENLSDVNTSYDDGSASESADGLTLFFQSNRPGGAGGKDLWYATRPDLSSPFGHAINISELNTARTEGEPSISYDGLILYFAVDDNDIWYALRPDVHSPFGRAFDVWEVNTPLAETCPSISSDSLTLYFTVLGWPDAPGGYDIYHVSRDCVTMP